MKHFYAFLLIVVLFVSGCQPSETAIQTAIAQTQAANPTSTFTPIPPTETPTETPTVTPTETPTITPSPTPDLRVIQLDPKDFLLQKSDLPLDAKYYLPNELWIGPLHNEQIVSAWTVEKGREYLAETGRLDGWWIAFDRGSNTVIAPQNMYDNVIMYKTAEGAQIVITKFDDRFVEFDYTEIKDPPKIGDLSRAFVWKEMQSSGEYRVAYRISFCYRNYVHEVEGWGWEHEVKPEYVENIARILLARLQAAPLSNP